MNESYILDAVRTPRGRGKAGKGALSGMHPQELLAQVLRGLAGRGTFEAKDVEDVMIGCVSQVNEQGANIARNAVLAAGWPNGCRRCRSTASALRASGGALRGHGGGRRRMDR